MEAAWRLQRFSLFGRSRSVVRLAVYTENRQRIVFKENKEIEALNKFETTSTAWFKLNQIDKSANSIIYVNIPKYYNFDRETKTWIKIKRLRKNHTLGRWNVISPKDNERIFLKLLVNRVTGATSFSDLKTFKDSNYDTYKETAIAMGLIADNSQMLEIFDEAITIMLPSQLRSFLLGFYYMEIFKVKLFVRSIKRFSYRRFSKR